MSPDVSSPPPLAGEAGHLNHLAEVIRATEESALCRAAAGDYVGLLAADHAALARSALARVSTSCTDPHRLPPQASALDVEQQLREVRRGVADDSSDASCLDEALDHAAALRAYLR